MHFRPEKMPHKQTVFIGMTIVIIHIIIQETKDNALGMHGVVHMKY